MTGQNLLTVQACCHFGGRVVDADFAVLGLGGRDGDHRFLNAAISENPDVRMLKQYPLTGPGAFLDFY